MSYNPQDNNNNNNNTDNDQQKRKSPYLPPAVDTNTYKTTNDDIPSAEDIAKKLADAVQPLVGPMQDAKDKLIWMLETGSEHSQRVKPLIQRKYKTFEDTMHVAMIPFHQYRRQYPWEMITGATFTAGLCSLPMGAKTTLTNTLLAFTISHAIVNPELLYDYQQEYYRTRAQRFDAENESTFVKRW
eukprot:UN01394